MFAQLNTLSPGRPLEEGRVTSKKEALNDRRMGSEGSSSSEVAGLQGEIEREREKGQCVVVTARSRGINASDVRSGRVEGRRQKEISLSG